jgi:hypothetical protein
MIINQGKRIDVDLPGYQGSAGFVERGETATLSYPLKRGGELPDAGVVIEIDGAKWSVEQAAKSEFVRNFRVLTLRRSD